MTRDGVPPAVPAGGGAGDGPRRCSQCGNHGHNARTCTARPAVKLFGVRIGDKPLIRKSVSMGNLAQFAEGSGGARAEGYGSEGDDDKPHRKRERSPEENKLQTSPSETRRRRRRRSAVGGAPPAKLLLMPWSRSLPKPAGSRRATIPRDLHRKSPPSSCRTTPGSSKRSTHAGSAAPRTPATGKSSRTGRRSCRLDAGSRSTPELLRAPPSRWRKATCKTNPTAPPPPGRRRQETIRHSALCTRRDAGFPRPPAAGATGGGRGNRRIGAGEASRLRRFTNPFLWYCSGEETGPRSQFCGESWSEEEHKSFLLGLKNLGRGDWRGISRNYVGSRTPTQVASHAQKYFIRQINNNRRKRRSSLFDMVIDDSGDLPLSRSLSQEIPLSHSSSQEVEEYVDDLRPVTSPVTPPAPVPVLTSSPVPPPVAVMAPPAPVPVLTYASAPPPVPAMAHQPEGSQLVGSSSYTGETGMVMTQVVPPYGYPMMFPPPHFAQAFYPVPYYGFAPMFYGPTVSVQASSPGTVQSSHVPVRPVAIHSSSPVNVEDLYSISELNLKGDSSINAVALKSPLPPNPNGKPERQSAFHGTGPANGSSNGLIPAK